MTALAGRLSALDFCRQLVVPEVVLKPSKARNGETEAADWWDQHREVPHCTAPHRTAMRATATRGRRSLLVRGMSMACSIRLPSTHIGTDICMEKCMSCV